MSIDLHIKDSRGKGNSAAVDSTGNLCISATGTPPEVQADNIRIFRQHMTIDGLPANGTNEDMQVVGTASTPISFIIPAAQDADRYIKSLSFIIADQNATLEKFGAITALTNGCHLIYEDLTLGTVSIHESLKSNWDFIRLCGKGAPPVGATTSAFRANNIVGNAEGYAPILDFAEQFGLPWGIRIPKASTLKLILDIHDDTTGVDGFDVIAFGFDRIVSG